MSDKPKLKRCPFCGIGPVGIDWRTFVMGGKMYKIKCTWDTCRIRPSTVEYPTVAEAVAAWNRRAK